jgi:hypothetical protein
MYDRRLPCRRSEILTARDRRAACRTFSEEEL